METLENTSGAVTKIDLRWQGRGHAPMPPSSYAHDASALLACGQLFNDCLRDLSTLADDGLMVFRESSGDVWNGILVVRTGIVRTMTAVISSGTGPPTTPIRCGRSKRGTLYLTVYSVKYWSISIDFFALPWPKINAETVFFCICLRLSIFFNKLYHFNSTFFVI